MISPPDPLELLKAREALLSEAERISHVGSYLWEMGEAPLWSDEFYRILGYEPGEVQPSAEAFYEAVHPEDLERVKEARTRALEGDLPEIEYRVVRHKTGEVRFVRGSGHIYRDAEGRVTRILGAIMDITEVKQSAIALEEALAVARAAERMARFGTFVVTIDPVEIRWSEGMRELTGLHDPDADTQTRLSICHPDDRERQLAWWYQLVANKKNEPIQVRMVRPDGELRHVYTHAAVSTCPASGVERIVGTTIDITERVALEEKLRNAAKMEAVGTLAAGIAHDFNNYLTAVSSTVDLLEHTPPNGRAELLDQAKVAVRRCTELTRELLAFARRQPFTPELVDVRDVIGRSGDLLRRTLGRRADLMVELGDNPLWARVDPSQLEQMLVNLVMNAGDAIEENGKAAGRVRIVAESVLLNAVERAIPEDVGVGHFIRVTVEDNGGGIDPEHIVRIFDPYFTTKPRGRGTGLGLASVYGTARQNGGSVTVRSLSHGTCFALWFPETDEQPALGATEGNGHRKPSDSRAEHARVLVVDDLMHVRSIAARALEDAGYETLEAANGVEALAVLERSGPVQLVLTDLQMPQMDGRTLAREALRLNATAHVILMTGYADDSRANGDEPALPVLRKPFKVPELVAFVRHVLGKGD